MADFIDIEISTDPDDLYTIAVEWLQDQIPGWTPASGNLETALLEAVARVAAESRDVAADIPKAIFRWYGANMVNIPPDEATSASTTATITMVDDAGYTVEAGTLIGIPKTGDELLAFEVAEAVEVLSGDTSTLTGEVVLVAIEPGADANDLDGTPVLIDQLVYIDTIVLEAVTSGGQDAESDDDYLDRLSEELTLLAPRPILPNDFAILAKRQDTVDRALAIDGYNPDDDTYNNERTVAIAPIDSSGAAVSSGVKTAIEEDLEARREVNFSVKVMDPEYTSVDIEFEATCYAEFDAADVETAAIAAMTAFISPAEWGQPPFGESREWRLVDEVRYIDVAGALKAVEGIWEVTLLEVNGGTADVALTGAAPLPSVGTITGTVTAP